MANDEDDKLPPGPDRLSMGPDIGGGVHPYIRHMPDHTIRTGFFQEHDPKDDVASRPLVHLSHVGPGPIYDVEDVASAAVQEARGTAGPAKVATRAYRDGWDRIFGGPETVGQA